MGIMMENLNGLLKVLGEKEVFVFVVNNKIKWIKVKVDFNSIFGDDIFVVYD